MLQSVVSRRVGYSLVTGKQQLRGTLRQLYGYEMQYSMGEGIWYLSRGKEGRQTLRCSPSKRTGVLVPILQMQKLRPRGM